jgi:hypothetical protein
MAVYPVGTPAIYELPRQTPLHLWKYPDDFSVEANPVSGLITKPSTSFLYVSFHDINYQQPYEAWPKVGLFECSLDGRTSAIISGTGWVSAHDQNPMVPPSVNAPSTPYPLSFATVGHYAQPTLPALRASVSFAGQPAGGVGSIADSGYVAMMPMTTSSQTTEAWPWNGPYSVDCGSGPNRLLLLQGWYWCRVGGTSVSTGGVRMNGAAGFTTNAGNGALLQPPDFAPSTRMASIRKIGVYWLDPPAGLVSVTFAWQGAVAGVIALSAYAGTARPSPVSSYLASSLTPAGPSTTQTLTTTSPVPTGSYWVSGTVNYGNPRLTPAVAGQQFGSVSSGGIIASAWQRGVGAGSPVTTTWALDSAQIGLVDSTVLLWDNTTVAPVISGQNQVTIVG